MKNTKIVIALGLHFILAIAIVLVLLPVIDSNDDGYHGAVPFVSGSDTQVTEDQQIAETETVVTESEQEIETVEAESKQAVEAVKAESEQEIETVKAESEQAVVAESGQAVGTAQAQLNDVDNSSAELGKENENSAALYTVIDGNKLDKNSYAGFKLYRNWCARCHGRYGEGMVGPNLAGSLKFISEKEFFNTVANGKAGTIGSMPAWKANPKVMAGRDQIYAYLMARSDGAIGVEKPKKQ